ncbi:MAG: hypothetical protein NVSMB19_25610 [Vulcanimicrobiaceae bacterium]
MKKISKPALLTLVAIGALAAPAAALTIPPMLPDICIAGHCIQFTRSTALAQVQALYQKATQLANEARNLKGIGDAPRTAVDQEVGAIMSGTDPMHAGDAAAGSVAGQAQGSAGQVAAVNAKAAAADGAQQQAQVSNLYLGTIATEAVKTNALAAEQALQAKNTRSAEMRGLSEIFSGDPSGGPAL